MIALLLLCVALISLNSHSTSKKAVSSENIQRAENASDLKDAERKNSSKNPLRLVISTVGDCTLGTDENFDYSTSLNSVYESNGKEYFFQNVRSVFEKDDLTIANAEGTFTTSTSREDKLFAFKADPEYAQIFSSSSVEAVTLANNHSHDYGEQSYEDTKTALDSAGVTHFGYDETAVLEIKGVKVGLVGIYELSDHMERTTQLKENIAKVKKDGAQLIITVFHWGTEKEISPDNNQTQLGRMAIDEGADLVVGHHPHVLQGIEKYKGKYIVYSLGNFCFGGNSYPSDMDTMIFQQTFTIDSSGVQPDGQIHVIPCSISSASGYNNYQPTPAQGSEAERILTKINERSQLIEGEGVILPLTE
nr:CapA family protein [Blautia hydrogenotrophica]